MRDRIRVEIRGWEQMVFAALQKEKIEVFHIDRREGRVLLSIKGKDRYKIENIETKYGFPVEIIKDESRKTVLKNNVTRVGIYLGIAVWIVATVLYSEYVFHRTIEGNEQIATERIDEAIQKYTNLPAKKKNLPIKTIEKEVMQLEGIANATVYLDGNVLRVKISEELEKAELFDRDDLRDVTSKYDATITRIIPYDGRTVVAPGQEVKAGEILLSSTVYLDETEELYFQTRAFGEIYGVVRFTKDLIFPDERIVTKRTGESKTYCSFFVDTPAHPPFERYELEREESYLYSIFPIKIVKTTYFETKEIRQKVDFEKNFEGILSAAKEAFFCEFPEGAREVNFSYAVKRLDKSTLCSLYYDVEIKIN